MQLVEYGHTGKVARERRMVDEASILCSVSERGFPPTYTERAKTWKERFPRLIRFDSRRDGESAIIFKNSFVPPRGTCPLHQWAGFFP